MIRRYVGGRIGAPPQRDVALSARAGRASARTAIEAFTLAMFVLLGPVFAEPVSVNVSRSHPNGTSVSILSVERGEGELRLGVRIVNGAASSVQLAFSSTGTYIQAGDDNRLMLIPPEDNQQLRIPGRSAVEGTLVFAGGVPDSGEMTVFFNGRGGINAILTPKLEIALPPEAIAAAGSKKN